jgi:hypothetical protein
MGVIGTLHLHAASLGPFDALLWRLIAWSILWACLDKVTTTVACPHRPLRSSRCSSLLVPMTPLPFRLLLHVLFARSSKYVAKIQMSLSPHRLSPENSVSTVLLLPLAKSVTMCVFEWFLSEAIKWYQSRRR